MEVERAEVESVVVELAEAEPAAAGSAEVATVAVEQEAVEQVVVALVVVVPRRHQHMCHWTGSHVVTKIQGCCMYRHNGHHEHRIERVPTSLCQCVEQQRLSRPPEAWSQKEVGVEGVVKGWRPCNLVQKLQGGGGAGVRYDAMHGQA